MYKYIYICIHIYKIIQIYIYILYLFIYIFLWYQNNSRTNAYIRRRRIIKTLVISCLSSEPGLSVATNVASGGFLLCAYDDVWAHMGGRGPFRLAHVNSEHFYTHNIKQPRNTDNNPVLNYPHDRLSLFPDVSNLPNRVNAKVKSQTHTHTYHI